MQELSAVQTEGCIMSLENTNLSRRNLLRAGALGIPAAGVLAFGSTLVTATSANAISADGWWGEETSAGFQRFMNAVIADNLVVGGLINSQPSYMKPYWPGIVGGWKWVEASQAEGSPTIGAMFEWLANIDAYKNFNARFDPDLILLLQKHYGIPVDYRLDGPSQTIMALQSEINQYVG